MGGTNHYYIVCTTLTLLQGLSPQILEMFEQLKRLMTTEKNYLTYRNVIKLANPPCIPYLGVFLTDLVFIDEAPGKNYYNNCTIYSNHL